MPPRELVERWVDAFNPADADALAAFYAEDAVNHQVAEHPVHGRAAIREMFPSEFALTKMSCIPEHIFEDGEWAISRVARSVGAARLRLFPNFRRQDRFSTRILGQAVVPPIAQSAARGPLSVAGYAD
jgi:hypothetical protein